MYTIYILYILPSNKCEIFHLNMFFLGDVFHPLCPQLFRFRLRWRSRWKWWLRWLQTPLCLWSLGVSELIFPPMPNRMYGEYLINTYDLFGNSLYFCGCVLENHHLDLGWYANQESHHLKFGYYLLWRKIQWKRFRSQKLSVPAWLVSTLWTHAEYSPEV